MLHVLCKIIKKIEKIKKKREKYKGNFYKDCVSFKQFLQDLQDTNQTYISWQNRSEASVRTLRKLNVGRRANVGTWGNSCSLRRGSTPRWSERVPSRRRHNSSKRERTARPPVRFSPLFLACKYACTRGTRRQASDLGVQRVSRRCEIGYSAVGAVSVHGEAFVHGQNSRG